MQCPSQARTNDRRPDSSSPPPVKGATDELAGLVSPNLGTAVGVKAAELMTLEEFQAALKCRQVHQPPGKHMESECKAKTPLGDGEVTGYSTDDVVAFYVARRGGDWRQGVHDLVKDAFAEKRPISASLWDAVVIRSPRAYVRDGEVYRPVRRPPDGFVTRKTASIPAWATAVALVANGIDGWPPVSDGIYSVEEFIKIADEVQRRSGGGEWDVLVYAVDDPNAGVEVHPYGQTNPYRRLRRAPGHRVKQIACLSYMRWDWYDFTSEAARNG